MKSFGKTDLKLSTHHAIMGVKSSYISTLILGELDNQFCKLVTFWLVIMLSQVFTYLVISMMLVLLLLLFCFVLLFFKKVKEEDNYKKYIIQLIRKIPKITSLSTLYVKPFRSLVKGNCYVSK